MTPRAAAWVGARLLAVYLAAHTVALGVAVWVLVTEFGITAAEFAAEAPALLVFVYNPMLLTWLTDAALATVVGLYAIGFVVAFRPIGWWRRRRLEEDVDDAEVAA